MSQVWPKGSPQRKHVRTIKRCKRVDPVLHPEARMKTGSSRHSLRRSGHRLPMAAIPASIEGLARSSAIVVRSPQDTENTGDEIPEGHRADPMLSLVSPIDSPTARL